MISFARERERERESFSSLCSVSILSVPKCLVGMQLHLTLYLAVLGTHPSLLAHYFDSYFFFLSSHFKGKNTQMEKVKNKDIQSSLPIHREKSAFGNKV